jgi:RimJ/RimL family protein N-acetyltransferase
LVDGGGMREWTWTALVTNSRFERVVVEAVCQPGFVPGRVLSLTLVPFTADLLPAVQPWFRHPEVRRWLGAPEWPARELRLLTSQPGGRHRGRTVLRAHSWVAVDSTGEAVAKVGGEVYDRWNRYDGSQPARPVVTAVERGPAMSLTYVVDPARWGRGMGRGALLAALQHAEVDDVRLFAAGIDADNEASRRCAASAGFRPDLDQPDWEHTIYYLLRRLIDAGSRRLAGVYNATGETTPLLDHLETVRAELLATAGLSSARTSSGSLTRVCGRGWASGPFRFGLLTPTWWGSMPGTAAKNDGPGLALARDRWTRLWPTRSAGG